MSEQYQYRKHIRYMKNIIPIALLAFLAILWVFILIVLLSGKESAEGIMPVVIVSAILALEAIFIRKFLGRFAAVQVSIDNTGITYTNYKGDTVIRFEDITEIKFPSAKYLGGWVKILSGKDTVRMTVVIENIQGFLLKLKGELDKRGMEDRYNTESFFKFFKTAVFSDESWQRVYRIWWKLLVATIITTGMSAGIGILLQLESLKLLITTVISFILPDVLYIMTEIKFGRKLAKLSNKDTFTTPQRDLEYEGKVYKQAFLLGALLYIILIAVEVIVR